MDVLLDSHSLIWGLDDPAKLSPTAAAALQDPDNTLHLSVATVWEIAIKVGKRRLPLSLPFRLWIDNAIAYFDLRIIQIDLDHAERQVALSFHHRDPIFDANGVNRIWT